MSSMAALWILTKRPVDSQAAGGMGEIALLEITFVCGASPVTTKTGWIVATTKIFLAFDDAFL